MLDKDWTKAREAIADSSAESSVYIGCDSVRYKKNGKWFARYATVVVLHKDSKHGSLLFHTLETLPDFGNKIEGLIPRLTNEVAFAESAFSSVKDVIGDRNCEIHLDINTDEKHASQKAAAMASGYILGSTGIEPKLKPNGWCATHAADHAARNM